MLSLGLAASYLFSAWGVPALVGDEIKIKDGMLARVLSQTSENRFTVTVYADPAARPSGELVIPYFMQKGDDVYEVVEVSADGFKQCEITSLKLANSVKRIGDNAFYGCTRLESITTAIDPILSAIGDYAFAYTYALKELSLPSVEYVGDFCFMRSALERVDLPGLYTIGAGAFQQCYELAEFTPCKRLKRIGGIAFSQCTKLNGFWIGPSVEEIGNTAFTYCEALKEVVIPRLLKKTGVNVFKGSALERVYVCHPDFASHCAGLDILDRQALREIYLPVGQEEQVKDMLAQKETTAFYDPSLINVYTLEDLLEHNVLRYSEDEVHFSLTPKIEDLTDLQVWDHKTGRQLMPNGSVHTSEHPEIEISWNRGPANHLNYLLTLQEPPLNSVETPVAENSTWTYYNLQGIAVASTAGAYPYAEPIQGQPAGLYIAKADDGRCLKVMVK